MEKGQLRWVNCGNDKLSHLHLKQITAFGEKTKVPFTNLIYYNTTKHESHTKQKEKTWCPHQVCLVIVSFRVWNRKIMYMYCITLKPCLEFNGGRRSSGGLICNEDDEVGVHSESRCCNTD